MRLIIWLCRSVAYLTSNFPVTAAQRVKDDGVKPADFVLSPCPWKGCRLVYVTATGLAACTFCNSLFSWAAAGESGGSSCLRSSSDLRRRSNFRLDSARLTCAYKQSAERYKIINSHNVTKYLPTHTCREHSKIPISCEVALRQRTTYLRHQHQKLSGRLMYSISTLHRQRFSMMWRDESHNSLWNLLSLVKCLN